MMVSPTGSGPTDRQPTPPLAAGPSSSAVRTTEAATGALAGAGAGVAASSLAGRGTITYAELDAKLEDWVRAPGQAPGEKRAEAKASILDCFKNSRADLDLHGQALTTLPIEICHLSHLQRLTLLSNQLVTVPAELGNLAHLKVLNLSSNRITVLPAELGNLSNITYLDLSGNQLTAVPASFSRLSNLRILDLKHNLIPSLPDELLTNFSVATKIIADRNRFLPVYGAALRVRLDALKAMGRSVPYVEFDVYDVPVALAGAGVRSDASGRAIMTLPEAISFWETVAGARAKPADFWSPLEEGKAELESFLTRQINTANFKSGNKAEKRAFSELLVKLLNEMATNEDFRAAAFTEIGHSNSSCDDREAYGLDKLATAWETLVGTKGKSDVEVAAFALGLARKSMIEEKAAKLGGDPIETALRLQIALKGRLKLPTATQKMLYASIASVSDAGALAIGTAILAATNSPITIARALIAQPVWQERLRALDEEERYEKVVAEVTGGTYASEDVRKGDMAAKLDELYLADTARWMEAHFDELKPLIG